MTSFLACGADFPKGDLTSLALSTSFVPTSCLLKSPFLCT